MMDLFRAIGVLLVLTTSPTFSYFNGDNTLKGRYLSVTNTKGFPRPGLRGMQRKQFSGSSRHELDNIVDSHFKVRKSASYIPPAPARYPKYEDKDIPTRLNTEAPMINNRNVNTISYVGQINDGDFLGQTDHKKKNDREIWHNKDQNGIQQIPENYDNVHHVGPPDFSKKYHLREKKSNLVNVNVHKTPSSDPQKFMRIAMNNNHPNNHYNIAPQPIYQAETMSNGNNSPSSDVRGATEERMSRIAHHLMAAIGLNAQVKANKMENRKRDAYYEFDMSKGKVNLMSDNMRKYIVNKDKNINVERKGTKDFLTIESQNNKQFQENPYAIFYRMHPESLDKQEVYVPAEWLEEQSDIYPTTKNKRLSVDFSKSVMDFRNAPPNKDIFKKVKIYEKIKNLRKSYI